MRIKDVQQAPCPKPSFVVRTARRRVDSNTKNERVKRRERVVYVLERRLFLATEPSLTQRHHLSWDSNVRLKEKMHGYKPGDVGCESSP